MDETGDTRRITNQLDTTAARSSMRPVGNWSGEASRRRRAAGQGVPRAVGPAARAPDPFEIYVADADGSGVKTDLERAANFGPYFTPTAMR